MKKIKRFPYYVFTPFLISIYAVLFLFVNNQHEYKLPVVFFPLIVSFLFSAVVFAIIYAVFRKLDSAVFLSSIAIFLALSYGRFLELVGAKKILSFTPELFLGVIVVMFLVFAIFVSVKFRGKLTGVCKILFGMMFFLVLFQIYQIISFEVTSGRVAREDVKIAPIKTDISKAKESYPDIYYIIPDRYAGQKAFQKQYGFDNSAFLNSLKDKGFYVPENSTTNYPKTFQSLGSSLNMEYLDYLTEQTNGGESKDESIVTPLIRNNKVLQFLKDHGYRYVHMGSWWEPTKKNENADYIFYPRRREYWGADEFTTGFYSTTILSEFLKTFFHEPSDVSKNPRDNLHRQSALQQFEELKKIPLMPGPKFVFAHILLPHDPFVFDKDCNPIGDEVVNKNTHQENYKNQVLCANKKLDNAIDIILRNSKNPPIIILQSDEGPFPMNDPISGDQAWGEASETALREKFPILNAYYLPGKDAKAVGFYDTITPVNSFRLLLNTYFGEDMPLLEDRNYIFQDDSNYYKFIDVTEIVS